MKYFELTIKYVCQIIFLYLLISIFWITNHLFLSRFGYVDFELYVSWKKKFLQFALHPDYKALLIGVAIKPKIGLIAEQNLKNIDFLQIFQKT